MSRAYNGGVAKASEFVTAVQEDDAVALLKALGVADAYRDGTLVCGACGISLRENGLGAARKGSNGEYEFACARLDCLEEFHTG